MNSDVRDILEIDQKSPSKVSKKKKIKRLAEPIKRPQGVHREVWGLICKDDMDRPPLIPSEEPKAYMHPKVRLRHGVRKWHWIPFKNPARSDEAVFCHWRCVNDDPNKEYPFAKYNKHIQLIRYTDDEYKQYLHDENWTRAETDYLLDLCQQFDLRFFIVHDRWDASKIENGKARSIDEIKDRYYKVIGVMQKLKSGDDSVYVFDLEHEQKRREQLEKLFNRTKEQVDEELYLIEELKKIEIRKREREKKQLEVNKLLLNLENNANLIQSQVVGNKARTSGEMRAQNGQVAPVINGSNNSTSNNSNKRIKNRPSGGTTGTAVVATNRPSSNDPLNRSTSNNTPGAMTSSSSSAAHRSSTGNLNTSSISITQNSGNNSLNNSNDNLHSPSSTTSQANNSLDSKSKKPFVLKTIESTGIKFTENKVAGVSLRSFKMKLPQSVGLKKTKAIEQLIDELQLEQKPIATESICDHFNDLRSDMVLLYELHQALMNYEYELQTLRHRYESVLVSKNMDMSMFETSYSTQSSLLSSLAQNNTPQKRISEIFETSITNSGGPMERRRKAAMNQTNFIKRLRGRNPS